MQHSKTTGSNAGGKKLTICQVCSCFYPSFGGVESFVYNLSTKLVKRGYRIKVITSSRGKPKGKYVERIDGIEVIRYPQRFFLWEAPIIPEIPIRLLKEKFDIAHIHGSVPGITDVSILMAKLRKKPVVLTYHYDAEVVKYGLWGKLLTWFYNRLVARLFIRMADVIIATTKSYASTSPVLSKLASKVKIVPCGVDSNRFVRNEGVENPSNGSRVKLLYVGKLVDFKGIAELIEASKHLKDVIGDFIVKIVGTGPSLLKYVSMAKEMRVSDVVKFYGKVDEEDLKRLYDECDVVVCPSRRSRREAFGIVILEAMAKEKPVIASRIPGMESVVVEGRSGLLVPPSNPKALADAIASLVKDKDRMMAMGRYGRSIVERVYDWGKITAMYENVYSLVSSKQ